MPVERATHSLRGKVKRVTPLTEGYRETLTKHGKNSFGKRTYEEKFSIEVEVLDDERVAEFEVFQPDGSKGKKRILRNIYTAHEITNYDLHRTWFRGRFRRASFRYSNQKSVEVEQ